MAGYTTESFAAARITRHGKIASLESAFSREGKPFSLFIIPKVAENRAPLLLPCQLYLETAEESAALPLAVETWSPAAIVSVAANETALTNYDLYWGE